MSKILVTGGAGFIGSAMVERLLDNPNLEIVAVDNLSTGVKSNLPNSPRLTFIKCDVNDYNDLAAVFHSFKFDYVFHYAALVGVQRTLMNPVDVLKDIDGIKSVLNLCKNTGVKRVFYASSSEVYGEPFEIPQNEKTTPLNSRLPYAIVKNVGEAYLRSFHQEYQLDYTIFRFFNTYGIHQSEDFVISKFMKAAMEGRDITIYGDGEQTRTFCYIKDNVDACYEIFANDHYVNDVVNIGSEIEIPIHLLATAIKDVCNSESEIKHLPPLPEGDMTRRKPDITKMKKVLQRNLIPLNEGLTQVAEHVKRSQNVRY
ncbi:MAG: NAD-dependent epimerase/dehydratase family protein [Flavobacteriales bacterium]|nr:NAD-dependent epimerase/dehydratase family protein [Flavobacteriales bacterium]